MDTPGAALIRGSHCSPFWQVTADLPLSAEVPSGHGHTYTHDYADGWATVLRTANWTPDKAERLRDLVSKEE
jgi:uncharacterized membrane protein